MLIPERRLLRLDECVGLGPDELRGLIARGRLPPMMGGDSYSAIILAETSLVGYWRLNDMALTAAVDSTSNLNVGTYSGAYTLAQPSIVPGSTGTCVSFAGGKMAVPDAAALRLGSSSTSPAWSVEVWLNISAWSQYAAVIDDTQRAYSFFFNPGFNANQIYAGVGGTSGAGTLSQSIKLNTLYHFVATCNASTLTIYLNSTSVYSATSFEGATASSSGVQLFGNPSGGGAIPTAKAQEFAVYNAVLTAAQVRAHYAAGAPRNPALLHRSSPRSGVSAVSTGGTF